MLKNKNIIERVNKVKNECAFKDQRLKKYILNKDKKERWGRLRN